MHSLSRDLAAILTPVYSGATVSATAGGTGDATAAPGDTIDLTALADRFESVAFAIKATATLAANKALTVTAKIETSADGTNWTDLTTSATVITLSSVGGGTVTGAAVLGCSLEYASKDVRVNVTPDLTATGTDTAVVTHVALFGGRRHES